MKHCQKKLKTQINRKTSPVHGLQDNIRTMSVPPKMIQGFIAVPIKIPKIFFTEIGKTTLKFTWNHKAPCIAKTTLIKKNLNRKTPKTKHRGKSS